MTRAEKFEEVFGIKVDLDGDCGFFDCSKIGDCKGCPFDVGEADDIGRERRRLYKKWWNEECQLSRT